MMKNTPPSRRKTAKDLKREETRARLLDAARRLFATHGYDNVTVTEIGKAAGVTHGMINVYFGGKPGLLFRIVQETNAPQLEKSLEIANADRPAADRLADMLRAWARCDGADPRLLSVMQSYAWVWPADIEEENQADRARFKELLARIVEDGQRSGDFTMTGDPTTAANAIFAIYTWSMRRAVFEDLSPDECHTWIMEQVRLVVAGA